jgi:lipopolysaccharide/colanic/teichoic acid biosynthesis glycosyltransferase
MSLGQKHPPTDLGEGEEAPASSPPPNGGVARATRSAGDRGEPLRAEPAESPPARTARSVDGRRVLDVLLACVLLVLASPVMLVAALAIRLEGGGPVLYRQRRYGKDMRAFTMLKFRTMTDGASSAPHRAYIARLAGNGRPVPVSGLRKLTDDARVTRVGRRLRRASLDELPQLLNVLAGHMSIVGPRPAIEYELEFYAPRHYERFAVRPGLTGLWQVSGRNRVGFLEMLDRDVEYVRRRSLALDLLILAKTPLAMFGGTA